MRHHRVRFSHFGIIVTDVAKMTDFYSRILGFPVTVYCLAWTTNVLASG